MRCEEGAEGAAGALKVAADPSPSPSSIVSAEERDRMLWAALGNLSEDYRQVLLLRHQQSCTFEEIGTRLGRSPNAARKLWLRALERLQDDLATTQ
jgi:RNA polymerase sigma-70 factor (ECF subfamily)